MRCHATNEIQVAVVDSFIFACKQMIAAFGASMHASGFFHKSSDFTSEQASHAHYVTQSMEHINNLDLSIELYNTALHRRIGNLAQLRNWGGNLHRSVRDMEVVEKLGSLYDMYPQIQKFDTHNDLIR